MIQLSGLSSPEVKARAEAGAVLVIPVGSTEQHGPHLPLSTDTDIAVALSLGIAERVLADGVERQEAGVLDLLVAPALPYGSSGEHEGFAGTLSIGQAATEQIVVELVRSARSTFGLVVLISGHGGNAEALRRAMATLEAESPTVMLIEPDWGGDLHAGATETSIQLYLRPGEVSLDLATVGHTGSLAELLPAMRSGGVRAVSPSGVLGDPTLATAEHGRVLMDEMIDRIVEAIARRVSAMSPENMLPEKS